MTDGSMTAYLNYMKTTGLRITIYSHRSFILYEMICTAVSLYAIIIIYYVLK